MSLTKGFALCSTDMHRKYHMGKDWDTAQKSLTEFHKGLSLTDLTDPDNKCHPLSTSVHEWSLPNCMVSFRKLLLTFVFAAFQQRIYTHMSRSGEKKSNSLRLQLYDSLK